MKATARSTFSTLGVILGVCTTSAVSLAQSLPGNAPPTAGFADPTPEEQRLLQGDSKSNTPVGGSAVASATPAPIAAPPPVATPQYTAAAAPAYQVPAYASAPPRTYAAPRQSAYVYSPPPSQNARYAYGSSPASDATADRGGDGASKDKPAKEEHFRIGVLGGVGFPRPLAIEGMIKVERLIGLGVEYSTLPSLTISGVDTSFWAIAATLRVFPFKDGFFLGVRGGRQHLGGEGTVTVAPYGSFRESVTIDSTFVNPRIGFLWTWSPGITLGIDAGVQIPVGATVSSSLPAGTVNQEVMDVAQALGNTTLPTIDLLKVGFLL